MKVLALAVDPYDFNDEESGRKVKGCNLTIVTDYAYPPEDKSSGYPAMKMSMQMPEDQANQLRGKLPAVLELNTSLKKGAGGKATQVITGFQVISGVDINKLFAPKI